MTELGFHVKIKLKRGRDLRHFELSSSATCLGLLGPSGAGKTTVVRILAGLERESEGQVRVGAQHLQGSGRFVPPWERHVGWVPQEATLFPHGSVLENLMWGKAGEAEAQAMAESLGIRHLLQRRPRHLSGGEGQRVAIGRALLAKPRILLLDEPFTALDPDHREAAMAVVTRYLEQTEAKPHLLLVSHQQRDLEVLCDEIWRMSERGELTRA